ncbi:trypsin-like serine peptidase [Nonomuraea sp. NPDC050383]|uniref:trypsin-like serine peptidase n=1 Tax=Nonomuraea sp. NPDC050383 TaxID=3364362 RepID=UPI00379ABBA3
MKRILIPAGGAILATGLLAAGLAGSASAAGDVATDPMAKSAADAKAIAQYWAESNGAALKAATESNVWDKSDVAKLQSKGGYSADTKPGSASPIGQEKKTTVKVQNVNLPKTIGKVFFVNSKGEKKWCSATSVQSKYRNLVSTAGHCVYDTAGNTDVMSKWVFVPGYYQGKTPWGIYVGKQAFTHYDFDVYEDYDRDYAFVTVYNGIQLSGGPKQVTKSEWDSYKGTKFVDKKEISAAEYDAGVSKYGENGPFQKESITSAPETVGKPAGVTTAKEALKYYTAQGIDGVKLTATEVTEYDYTKAPNGLDNNAKFVGPTKASAVAISQEEYKKLQAEKADGKFLGKLWADKDAKGNEINWHKQQYFIKKWVKSTTKELYWVGAFYIVDIVAKDAGRLGDNVGGQGVAWNQPTGKYVRVFGYPAAAHPDGNKNFTGITPKWCYGKTSKKLVGSAAKKIEEHVALKCSMTEGADGGPWLVNYSNSKRLGYVNGVTSTFNDQDANGRVDYISSPYFDGETAAIYKSASNVWSGKIL